MSSLKKNLMKRGMQLMSDPRVLKLMQDERVMKAMMQVMAMPGKVQSFTQEQVERLAKSMALATEDEVKDLKRTVRRLEEDIARMKQGEARRDRLAAANAANNNAAEERPSTRSLSGTSVGVGVGGATKKKATTPE